MIIEIILTIFCSLIFSYLFFKLYVLVMRKKQERKMIAKIKEQKSKGYTFYVPTKDKDGRDIGEKIDLVELIERQFNPPAPPVPIDLSPILPKDKPLNKKVILQNIDEDDI